MTTPTERFASRVENYIRYRPSYPTEIIKWLGAVCGLSPASTIADVGSGTGILSELFLQHGNAVWGVEPNQEMRAAAERLLRGHARFTSVAGAAEATTLPAAAYDFVTAGQAFHWFDRDRAQVEFARILKPHGWCVLLWNERLDSSTEFAREYEQLLRTYSPDYVQVDHRRIDAASLARFFDADFQQASFANRQDFDYSGLEGRLLSSSYAPEAGHANYAPMIAELRRMFERHQRAGAVSFEYDTKVYCGRLSRGAAGGPTLDQ